MREVLDADGPGRGPDAMTRIHARGCRYEGSDQPCGQASCREALMQEVRVLLTDAYVIFGQAEPDGRLKIDKLGEVWRSKYERLIGHIQPGS